MKPPSNIKFNFEKKLVYIAHPISGDVDGNIKKVVDICKALVALGEVVPCAPYLSMLQYLDDADPKQREIGMAMSEMLIPECDEFWMYGDSKGVSREKAIAEDWGIPVVDMRS